MSDRNADVKGNGDSASRSRDAQSAARRRHRAPWSLVGLMAAFLLAGAVGCRGTRDEIPPVVRPERVEKRSLQSLKDRIILNALGWETLDAKCDVAIRNLSIPRPDNLVELTNGRISLQRPGKVNLKVPELGRAGLRLIGDGSSYRVEILGDVYSGSYGDPISAQPQHMHFMPEDVADAFDPSNLVWDKAQTLTQDPVYSHVYSLDLVQEPRPGVRMTSSITIDRRREQNLFIVKYDQDGSVRTTIRYGKVEPMSGREEEEPVEVPTVIRMDYPDDPTAIIIRLRDVRLNVELNPALFELTD